MSKERLKKISLLPFAFNSSICKHISRMPNNSELVIANDINGKEFWPQGNDFELQENRLRVQLNILQINKEILFTKNKHAFETVSIFLKDATL